MKFLGGLMGVKADLTVAPRGFLGVEIAEGDDGVTIKTVLADGPAAKAGLKPGDRIRKLGDSGIRSAEDFRTRLGKSPEGAKHTVTVLRDGRERVVTLELGRGL
jgi:putative serine protease PepD